MHFLKHYQFHFTAFASLTRLYWMVLVLLSLTACSSLSSLNPLNWFGDEEVNPPNELMVIDNEVQLRRQWQVRVGNGQGDNYTELTPAIDNGVVFAAAENGTVVAVSLDRGNVLWRQRLDNATLTGGVGAGGGLVVVGTRDAEVYALDQADGTIVWVNPVTSEVVSAPIANDDLVVVQTVDDKVAALEASNGERRWIYESTQPALTLRGTSRPVFTPVGTVVAGFSNGTLVSVSAADGVWRWEERVAVPEGNYDIERVIDVDGDLLLDGNRILAASYQGNLMALDTLSGRIVWGLEGASSYHGLTQGFGNLYYCNDQGHIIAVRDNSEDVVWQNEDLQFRALTAPAAITNYIAVGDFEGYLHLLSQIDGRIVGRVRVDNEGLRANLLVADGQLIAFGNSGQLTVYRLQ
ncbi:MAG: outer membrane protein assembly factor BamB [Gammaproteobacteria bacterium]|nr:outer membrane protein assembly factor BamB [Gammaproteobacteria bacterium]